MDKTQEDATMNEATSLDALSSVLTKLAENPHDLATHAEHVRVAQETGLEDQVEAALDMLTDIWPAGDYAWIPLLDKKLKDVDLESAEGLTSVLELFQKAERDYLSIPILKKHLEFLVERHAHFAELDEKPEGLGGLFTSEWTRNAIEEVVNKGIGHLTESQELWEMQREWESEILQNMPESERGPLVARMEEMLLTRLQQPHSEHDATFQAYSSFTTAFKPADEYEPLLVQASKSKAAAVKAWNRREQMETSLRQAGYSLEGYQYYIASEVRAKNKDLFVLTGLYERAIAEADRRRWNGEPGAEEVLRSFWIGYVDVLRQSESENEQVLSVFKRATRSVPGSGEIWSRYLRFLERTESESPSVAAAYESALSYPPIHSDVEALVSLILARAGYEKRLIDSGNTEDHTMETLVHVLIEGIARVRQASKAGDPRLRVEKFFSALCFEREHEGMREHAISVWQDAAKHYKTSYLAWTEYTDTLTKLEHYDTARKTFKDIALKNLDWPEAIWEAWVQFEHLHGSVKDIEECLDRIEKARAQVNARRAKEAEKAAYAAMQIEAEKQANVLVDEVIAARSDAPGQGVSQTNGAEVAMDVDGSSGTLKRKAEEEVEEDSTSKKARTEQKPVTLKRDRENSTVFVADLPADTTEEDLKQLFKDCGPIREIKLTQLPNSLVATVEFMDRESVPAGLTKDKKRIHGQEIAVHLAWKLTLYVTNFPEKADDAYIRELFGKYGVIFDVRWPSKKFKSTRRFCYVQYTSTASAEAALELHGRELEPGRRLSVLISNPERKKERTDSDANDREIYVAGLSKFVSKGDLEKLFSTYGSIKEVRMDTDERGHSKGVAFVEFEQATDAISALAANNHELKRRRIAVTLADTRRSKKPATGRKPEIKNRSVRIKNLPPGTQEGLLQQALEKRGAVKRVEVFADKNEAVAELENPAEAGKLLLHPDPLVFNGNTLELTEETLADATRPVAPPVTGGLFVPRSAVSRPRAGLGSKKGRGGTVVSAAAADNRPGPSVPSTQTSNTTGQAGAGAKTKGQDDFRKMLGGA